MTMTTTIDKAASETLQAARVAAMKKRPYFVQALCAIKLVEKRGIGTMACDAHWRVYYDPEVVKRWGVPDSVVGLLHELGHLLQRHHTRAKFLGVTRATMHRANVAQDCAINCMLLTDEDVGLKLLASDPLPKHFKLNDGLTWEEYFALLPSSDASSGNKPHDSCGSGATGVVEDWEDAPPSEKGDDEAGGLNPAEVEAVIGATAEAVRSHISKHGKGSVPGGLDRWAGVVMQQSQVPWTTILQRLVSSAVSYVSGANEHTYSRPSRRAHACPDFLLASTRDPVVEIVGIVDTSGSMADGDTQAALTEVQALCRKLGAPLRVLSVDSAVHTDQMVNSAQQVRLRGGGGTSMVTGIKHVVAMRKSKPCDVLVVFTDGGTDWPERRDVPRDLHLIFVLIGRYAEHAVAQVPSWARHVLVKSVNKEEGLR